MGLNSYNLNQPDRAAVGPLASNWGPETVDISTPGENLESIDHLGAKTFVSGSSFAVPRIAALAARFQSAHPRWRATDIKQAILMLAGPSPGDKTKWPLPVDPGAARHFPGWSA